VLALSANGSVAAGYLAQGSGATGRAVTWDANGHPTFIDLANMSASRARGISADGSVVVGWGAFNSSMVRAFRWTAATGMVNIGSPDASGPTSDAFAITPDGSVIVGTAQPSAGAPSQAALWTGSSGPQFLGSLSPTVNTTAYAVSADGRSVVGASGAQAFIWRAGRGMEDLQAVLSPPPGWTLTDADGLSADGMTIVGTANIAGVGTQAWIATLPTCYANCDGSTVAPVLNVLDFSCFLNRFAAGDSYANCDSSTVPPVLNVLDFSCFLNRFAAGCP
jgi:probable HAF family extracellular repeat protein